MEVGVNPERRPQASLDEVTIACETAAEFLDYIRPSKDHWRTQIRGKLRWVFRGQRDESWMLTPAAWRLDDDSRQQRRLLAAGRDRILDFNFGLERCRLYIPKAICEANEQTESELKILQEFVAHVNIAGLNFPHDTLELDFARLGYLVIREGEAINTCSFPQRFNSFYTRVLESPQCRSPLSQDVSSEPDLETSHFSPPVVNFTMRHPIAALAQHHGIPTRLLDWTHDSRKAAFFAARGTEEARSSSQIRRIAVWALNPFMLRNRFVSQEALQTQIEDDLSVEVFLSTHSIYQEKYQTTTFLAAQEGLFTCPEHADLHHIFTGRYPELLTSLLKMRDWEIRHERQTSRFPLRDYIRKITLPYSELDQLLEMLDDERVMLTTLMPSLDKIKECMLARSARKERLQIP